MAINHDVATFNGTAITSTGDSSAISHAGNASARAAVVLIEQNAGVNDEVNSVTYGGVTMTRVRSESESTEAGRVYVYWKDGIPGGTQDVVINTSAGTSKYVTIATMTVASGYCVAVMESGTGTSTSVSNPSWNITGLTSGTRLVAYEVIHSGLQTMTSTPAASWSLLGSPGYKDNGAQGYGCAYQVVASCGTSLTCGWTAGTADDFVGDSVAFFEGNDYTRSQTDTVGLTGNPTTAITHSYTRSQDDPVGLTDAVSVARDLGVTVDNSVGLTGDPSVDLQGWTPTWTYGYSVTIGG